MIITESEWTCLLKLLWSSTIWKLLQRLSSFLPEKSSSFEKTFSTKLQFVWLLLQWIQTLHSLKIISGINILSSEKLEDHYVLVFDLTSMQDATENFHYPELVREPPRLELNFTFPLKHVIELIVLGERMSSVAVDRFGVVGKNVKKWIILLCNKSSIVSLCSSFGISVRSPLTMFQLSIMTLLLLSTRKPAKCRVNIGSWLQISDMNSILQTFLHVKGTVFSTTSTTSRWCRHPFSLTQVYAAFIQYLQPFISSSFDKKKLQEFTILMYSLLRVITVNFSMLMCYISCFCPFSYNLFNFFELLHKLFT